MLGVTPAAAVNWSATSAIALSADCSSTRGPGQRRLWLALAPGEAALLVTAR